MKIKSIGANKTEITTGDVLLFVSYETPVACHIAGEGFFRTDKKWSVTTSKHISQFISRHGGSGRVVEKPQEWFNNLLAANK
jgi:hypothetical protein